MVEVLSPRLVGGRRCWHGQQLRGRYSTLPTTVTPLAVTSRAHVVRGGVGAVTLVISNGCEIQGPCEIRAITTAAK
jgi:hypothetical protein